MILSKVTANSTVIRKVTSNTNEEDNLKVSRGRRYLTPDEILGFMNQSIYDDRYFTSELLLDLLLNREVFATGTLMKNSVLKLAELQTDREMKRNGCGTIDQIDLYGKKKLLHQMVL
ncbi:DDE_Tnp_1_7 domain-containing protein [Nephila pilipes]|uniref:DDE_Tnp_1_7 domain-containing protein n=1 Tax=Nephila pilipes TaxID=299642 RepID=A0A8X6MUA3_NEPPI|nr:DDE_Tnp_1_7 domain-containing protein [Nephila pilipes]